MRFNVTDAGRNCSDVGNILLADSAHCQLAAKILGKVFESTIKWKSTPEGCIISENYKNYDRVYWNTHPGAKSGDYKAICQITGKNYVGRYSMNVNYLIEVISFDEYYLFDSTSS